MFRASGEDGLQACPARVGVADLDERDDLDLEAVRRKLEALRAELLDSSDAAAEDRQPVELDQQRVGRLSRMDALQVQAMAQAVEGRRQGQLKRIDAALARLEAGDYGWCEGCGEAIPAKRLEIDPAASLCVACAG